VLSYNALMRTFARRYDESRSRDPETGVLSGAAAYEAGPDDADAAVVLVHGFIGATNNFGELPERLAAAGHRVYALRLPGHGTTPFDLEETDPAEMLNHVIAKTREAGEAHEHVFLVGHSMGGALSLLTSTIVPVDGLVLAAPHFKTTHRWWYLLPPETWANSVGQALRMVYKTDAYIQVNRQEAKDDIVSYRYVPTSGGLAAMDFAEKARHPATLKMVTCPVLLLHARDDSAASPDAAKKAFEKFGSEDGEFVWLDRSDHHVFWDYDREQVYQRILEFIATRTD